MVQVARARDMALLVGAAAGRMVGQVMAHVEHPHAAGIESGGQVGGGNQRHGHRFAPL
ncbi:Uncharacterised protein [Bordetella pertussis]|nr:Uncharacterised protein [Bordetella pertussis]